MTTPAPPPGVRAPAVRLPSASRATSPAAETVDDLLAAHPARGTLTTELPSIPARRPKVTWRPTPDQHARMQNAQQQTRLKQQAILDAAFADWADRHGF